MPDDTQADLSQTVAALRRELDTRTAERDEALAREAAIAEVLQVINSSPGDAVPVFQAIVEKAHTLCSAVCGSLQLWDGEKFRGVAMRGFSEAMVEALRQGYSPGPNHPCRGLIDGHRIAHCIDMAEADDPATRLGAKLSGIRTVAYVALRKDDALLGQIVAGRLEVRPYTDTELALLENFAAQAVIALENARLLTETREALEQQTATAEVLQVINSSPGDLGLVFETLLGTGARLCKAEQAAITLRNPQDGLYHYGASFGYGRDFKDLLIRNPVAPDRASLTGRTALEGGVVHIEDAAADPEYKWAEALRLGRWHTGLGAPLLRDGAIVGTLALTRRRIERFTNKQIELIKTFADQAVVAIENTRLLGELRESEERYGLVSKAVAEGIYEWDVEHNSLWVSSRLIEIFGLQGRNLTAADWNDLVHPEDFAKYRTALRDCFTRITERLDCEYRVRHNDGQYRWIEDRGVPVRNASGRAVKLVGAVSDISARKAADEALREALEQQTATAEVLGVINSSPGHLSPVFEAILDKAHTLCGATLGSLFLFDGELFRAAATHGYPEDLAERLHQGVVLSATTQLLDDDVRWVHNPDLTLLDTPTARAVSGRGGVRTNLMLPLRKDGRLLGAGRSALSRGVPARRLEMHKRSQAGPYP
jgi:PAS domain S-box-containing protein